MRNFDLGRYIVGSAKAKKIYMCVFTVCRPTLFYSCRPSGLQIRVCTGKLFFLFLSQNICCGYSKEPSQCDGCFEHPKHIFKLTGKEVNVILGAQNYRSYLDLWTLPFFSPKKTTTTSSSTLSGPESPALDNMKNFHYELFSL